MSEATENFITAWNCYLENLKELLKSQAGGPPLADAVEKVIEEIQGMQEDMWKALADEDAAIVALLALELEYFCQYGDPSAPGGSLRDVLRKAHVIKTSIERLIDGLPVKLRKLLDILNELFELVQ